MEATPFLGIHPLLLEMPVSKATSTPQNKKIVYSVKQKKISTINRIKEDHESKTTPIYSILKNTISDIKASNQQKS